MEQAIIAAIGAILTIVEQALPLIGGTAPSTSVIGSVITALEKWLPLIATELPSATQLIASIKGMIASLSANPDTTPAQYETLRQLDAQSDAANDAAWAKVNPDAPPAPTT